MKKWLLLALMLLPSLAFAEDKLDTGDTAWMMMSAALILLMTPAGLWGALATGFLALDDQDLLWDGPLKETGDRMGQFIVQLESVVVVGLFTLIGTVVVYYIASALTGGGRVDEETEEIGLDEVTHGEKAINI